MPEKTTDEVRRFTCWSCGHYRADGCAIKRAWWPDDSEWCDAFTYEPGSDELERPQP